MSWTATIGTMGGSDVGGPWASARRSDGELEAPRSIFARGPDGDHERELTCGRQDLPLRVRYLPWQEPGRGGTLLTLDILEEGSSAPAHPQVLRPAAHGRLMRPGHHARAEAWLLIASL